MPAVYLLPAKAMAIASAIPEFGIERTREMMGNPQAVAQIPIKTVMKNQYGLKSTTGSALQEHERV